MVLVIFILTLLLSFVFRSIHPHFFIYFHLNWLYSSTYPDIFLVLSEFMLRFMYRAYIWDLDVHLYLHLHLCCYLGLYLHFCVYLYIFLMMIVLLVLRFILIAIHIDLCVYI